MAIKIIKNKKFKILASETSKQMKELNVPGVAIGIIHGKKEYATGLGITSTENPLPVMENTLFQIGSISKPFLATAVMRLVEKKKIDLDIPITKYLPDLKLSTKETTKKVTMRHLLTHTGGWFGDHFKDFGDGDDALEKIVDDLEKLPQLSPLGKIWGYNNSGFYIAGRILEVIMKKPYAKIIKELILDPLDMKMTFFSAKDIMTYRFAVGHSAPKKHLKIIRPWTLPKSVAPAGKIISNVNDMLKFANFYLSEGTTKKGKKLLSKKSMFALQNPSVSINDSEKCSLSWFIEDFPNKTRVLSHGGGINGQQTYFQIIPSKKTAAIIFSNCNSGVNLYTYISKFILKTYCKVNFPPKKIIKLSSKELKKYTGKYTNRDLALIVSSSKNRLQIKVFPNNSSAKKKEMLMPSTFATFFKQDSLIFSHKLYEDLSGEFIRDEKDNIKWLRFLYRIFKKEK